MPAWTIDASIVAGQGGALMPWVTYQLVPYGAGSTRVYRWSDVPVALRDGFVEPRVLAWTRVVRALADDYGRFEAQQFGWTLSDADRALLDLTSDPAYKYWNNRLCVLSLCNLQGLLAGDTPLTIARGVVRDVGLDRDRRLRVTVEDVLSTEFSATYLDELLPRRRITTTVFADCYDGRVLDAETGVRAPSIVGLPEPVIYGLVTDADLAADQRRGACPGLPVGTESIGGNPSWVRVLLAGHACKAVDTVYLGGVAVDAGRYGVDILCPGKAGWPFGAPYRDVAGRRYTLVYLIGPAATGVVDGSAPLTADVQGVESVGDGSGTLLTSVYDQYRHWLINFAFGDYQAGAWLPAPTYSDGTALIDSAAFDTAKVDRPFYDGGGIVGANGDLRTKQAWLAAWNTSGDLRSGFTRLGQFTVTTGEPRTPALRIDGRVDVVSGSLAIEPRLDELRNVIPFSFRRDWPRAAWTTDERVIYSQASIDAYGMRRLDDVRLLWFVRTQAVADDIAYHFLHRKMHPPRRIAVETGLQALLADLGSTVTIAHQDGTAAMASGATSVLVERVETDLGLGLVRLGGWDYGTLEPYPMPAAFAPGFASIGAGASYSYGTGVAAGGSGGGTTTVVTLTAPSITPVELGGSRQYGYATAVWRDAPDYSDKILNSSQVAGGARFRCHQKTSDPATSVQVRVIAIDGNGTWLQTCAEGPTSTNTSWGYGEPGHYVDVPFTPRAGTCAYRLEIKGANANADVWVAGAHLLW